MVPRHSERRGEVRDLLEKGSFGPSLAFQERGASRNGGGHSGGRYER